MMLRRCIALIVLLAVSPALGNSLQFNDPLHEQQWYLKVMRFDAAWSRLQAQGRPYEPITVAVIDSGFDLEHPDLAENVLPGHNIVDGSEEVGPLTAHGTGTTGPIGAISNNALGISQAAWSARVLPIRVTNRPDARARTADIAEAIRYAADQGARVINASYGGVQTQSINEAGRYAQARGAVVIMPAGNDGKHQTSWERQPNVFAVGAVTRTGERASFSNHGRFVDFQAPGHRITSLNTDEGYARWNGTSFASPLVASAAALVMAANPDLTPGQVYDILRQAADDEPDRHADTLPGVIDADRAVELAFATVADARQATPEPIASQATGDANLQSPACAEADRLQWPQGYVVEYLRPDGSVRTGADVLPAFAN